MKEGLHAEGIVKDGFHSGQKGGVGCDARIVQVIVSKGESGVRKSLDNLIRERGAGGWKTSSSTACHSPTLDAFDQPACYSFLTQ